MGLTSLAMVHKHISNLETKGLLKRGYNRSRSIDLLPVKGKLKQAMGMAGGMRAGASAEIRLPLMGRIAAGLPGGAVETPETISLADFVQSKEVFVLQVRGESMQDEHIVDGDYVLVEKTKTGHNGDIVAALENEQRGNAADAVASGRAGVLVDVHLGDFHFAGIALRNFVDDGRQGLAGATPNGPKINQNGLVGLENFLIEVRVSHLQDCSGCHDSSEIRTPRQLGLAVRDGHYRNTV